MVKKRDRMPRSKGRTRPRWASATAVAVVAVAIVAAGVYLVRRAGLVRPMEGEPSTTLTAESTYVPPEVPEEWLGPHGRWHIDERSGFTVEEHGRLTEEQQAEIERLESIGYLDGSQPVPEESGVTVYDPERALDGLNFYTTGDVPGAVLMDMHGKVLHKWAYSYIRAWVDSPDRPELRPSPKGSGFWRRAFLFENGDLLAVFDGLAIIKIDKDSNLLWVNFGGFHHDLDVMEDGRIYVLTRQAHIVPSHNPDEPILEDYVAVLDRNGKELRRVSVYKALMNSVFAPALNAAAPSGDILHSNTVEVLDDRNVHRIPEFRPGNVLVTIRELDLVVVIDMRLERVVWALTGDWVRPHQATILENGNLMIFDNQGNRGCSSVIELNPATLEHAWSYEGDPPTDFASGQCGSNHRLSNGNTLIVESDRGTAFEVTSEGTIVWKYVNPARAGLQEQYIATLFEVERLPPDFPIHWARRQPGEDD